MQFEFATASRIIFGPGKLDIIGAIITGMGSRALVISGAPYEITERLQHLLDLQGITSNLTRVESEPTVETIRDAVEVARLKSITLVIGIGGGSTLDTAKTIAALMTNQSDITDYLEAIGQNKPLTNPALPLIAIPTTAGTGSEVTRNAVIGSPHDHVKVSLRSPYLLPRVTIVDPLLTITVPPELTASTGLDALTQLIEPYTCNNPNPLTDALCIQGLSNISSSFIKAYDNGTDIQAREAMSLASLFSGLALANAKLGAVHGLAGPIGGVIPAPHGAICAALLSAVMEANLNALITLSPDHPTLHRYTTIAKLLSGNPASNADAAVQWVKDICYHMKIQPLSVYGLDELQFTKIIEKALQASSMKGNPITLSEVELRNILQRSL